MSEKNVPLMRERLNTTISDSLMFSDSQKSPHAGLYLQRGLCQWDKNDPNVKSDNRKSTKEELIDNVSKISFSPMYTLAYERWKTITSDEQRFAVKAAKIVGRLYTGLSSATALETGLTTHHTYGMPMLVGSSVKGAVASYAEKIGITLKTHPDVYRVLFGDEAKVGAVVWHDAWWIPNASVKPFVGEIITTHHQDYYNGKQEQADEMESPIPNQQIACQGSFYFVVECDNKAWADFANQLLFEMLQNQGMGSKTASGYGYFVEDEESLIDSNDFIAKLAIKSEKEIAETLGKNRNTFLEKNGFDKDNIESMKKLVNLILANEKLKGYFDSWRNQSDENKKKAVKLIDKYQS